MWLGALDGKGPIYRQVYRAIRRAILGGRLSPGQRLPSTRWVALDAAISRNRVTTAYAQLLDEGYLVGRVGSGTNVASELPIERITGSRRNKRLPRKSTHARLSRFGRLVKTLELDWGIKAPLQYDFHYGRPNLDDFPHSIWRRIVNQELRTQKPGDLEYGVGEEITLGRSSLRLEIAAHLQKWRGVSASPDRIIVTNGAQQAFGLVARLLLDRGDYAAIEDPQYPGARVALQSAGGTVLPIPVDEQGIDVSALARDRHHPRLVFVTPSHQLPTGAVLPLARRLALLRLAERLSMYVIEDDYDSEYRYVGTPVESLYGLDSAERVIYIGTFSKIAYPAMRIGYAVVPSALVESFARAKAIADFGNAQLEQRVLARFMLEGHLDVHVRRSRRRHGLRRDALLKAISENFGDSVQLTGAYAGLHLAIALRHIEPATVPAILEGAQSVGVGLYSTELYYSRRRPRCAEFLLGHGSMSQDQIREGIGRLAGVIRDVTAHSRKRRATPGAA